jgi:hypothetical protein
MRARDDRLKFGDRLAAHAVDGAFGLLVAGCVLYLLSITWGFFYWADDLRLINQSGSWHGLIEPYNGHMSVLILSVYRVSAELFHLSFTPFIFVGVLSLVAVPVSYFITTRRQLGPPLAAILAMPLLWYDGMLVRAANLNHLMALVGGMFAAAALNRGRRADGVLAAALVFSLCSAAGGVVVAGACLVHNALTRASLRRWLAVLVPLALWACWWFLVAGASSRSSRHLLSVGQAAGMVRGLCFSPFSQAAFGIRPLAAVLLAAFFLYGAVQLRRGLAAGANFVAWSSAMVLWAVALVQNRGSVGNAHAFRYTYLSLGFALLAVVPSRPVRWPEQLRLTNRRRWLATAAVVVLVFGGARALYVRGELRDFAKRQTQLGRDAKGITLVLGLGQGVIPGNRPIIFYGFFPPHGIAWRMRLLLDRYGSPFHATASTADQALVDLGIVQSRLSGARRHPDCRPLSAPVKAPLGQPVDPQSTLGPPVHLWSPESFTVDVRRYGEDWVRLADVPSGRNVFLSLPGLQTDRPWEIRADGACVVPGKTQKARQ